MAWMPPSEYPEYYSRLRGGVSQRPPVEGYAGMLGDWFNQKDVGVAGGLRGMGGGGGGMGDIFFEAPADYRRPGGGGGPGDFGGGGTGPGGEGGFGMGGEGGAGGAELSEYGRSTAETGQRSILDQMLSGVDPGDLFSGLMDYMSKIKQPQSSLAEFLQGVGVGYTSKEKRKKAGDVRWLFGD